MFLVESGLGFGAEPDDRSSSLILRMINDIVSLYGRDLFAALLAIIVGLLAIKWIARGIRPLLERWIADKHVAATTVNVVSIILLALVLMSAAVVAGFQVQPIFSNGHAAYFKLTEVLAP